MATTSFTSRELNHDVGRAKKLLKQDPSLSLIGADRRTY